MRSEVLFSDTQRILELAGYRYWTASLLPALIGSILPFWLQPPGFSFRWLAAMEFIVGTLLIHAGFSSLHTWVQAGFRARTTPESISSWLISGGVLGIGAGCLIGMHLNSGLSLHDGVPKTIFIIYGLATLIAGAFYVIPPASFWCRAGGEVVLCEGLGLLPILGAYLVQVGDISRTVYLASLPVVVATGLWVWMDELITGDLDRKQERQTMVILFGPRFSALVGTTALSGLYYVALFVAVLSASLSPLALAALVLLGLVRRILISSWRHYNYPGKLLASRDQAFHLHLFTGVIMILSSLVPLVF